MKLKFYCTDGTEKAIADVKDLDEADKAINKYLEDNNIKCYYARHGLKMASRGLILVATQSSLLLT